jgi:HAD superfamily hydrolase (TIGR01549 family)
MNKFSCIVFDIDGTLVSTNELIFASFNHVTNKYLNKSLSPEEIIALFGPPEDIILVEWFGEISEQVKEEYYRFYTDNHKKMAVEIEGLKEVLELIKFKSVPMSIFTGKGRKTSLITLQQIGMLDYFDLLVTGDDVKNHKPFPDGLIKIMEHYNADPGEVLLIGDAPSDIEAAKAAGIKSATVLWDCYAVEKVYELKGDYYFSTVKELKEFISDHI